MAPSNESNVLLELYADIKTRLAAYPQHDIGWTRLLLESLANPSKEPTDVTYDEVLCPGTVRPAIWCKPINAKSTHVILYTHGGGGLAGSPSSHRKFVGHLAKAAGIYALLLDYHLAPEAPFPQGLKDVGLAFKWLQEQGYPSKNIVLSGDSAGGNLALGATLLSIQEGGSIPAAIAVFSPWLDMEGVGKSWSENEKRDALATKMILVRSAQGLLGSASPKDPLANPLYADYTGFPPLYVAAGSDELLLSDSETVTEKAKAAGVEVILEVVDGMQHDYIFLAGNAPEADKTIAEVGKFFAQKLNVGA